MLFVAEWVYFRIAAHFNIIDKPNERSSHLTLVLRGGGIIFSLSMIVWAVLMVVQGNDILPYLPFLCGLVLICGISFWDDVQSLPDSVRLVVQFAATLLMFWSITLEYGVSSPLPWYVLLVFGIVVLIVFVGAMDVINFMDGINGITAAYALSALVPLWLMNRRVNFVDASFLGVAIIGVLVFSWFNFRPKGKAKCFAGDVGSIGIGFILLFAIGMLMARASCWL